MHIGRADGFGGRYGDYEDKETRKAVFWMNFKKILTRLIVIGLIFGAYVLYSIHNPVPDAVRNVANVDRQAAAREAIELYAEAHPEYTEEEIEVIFRNVVH